MAASRFQHLRLLSKVGLLKVGRHGTSPAGGTTTAKPQLQRAGEIVMVRRCRKSSPGGLEPHRVAHRSQRRAGAAVGVGARPSAMAAVVRKCQPYAGSRCGRRARGLHGTESGGFMTDGLLAPLSPPEEIALRRIAHGSLAVVDPKMASKVARSRADPADEHGIAPDAAGAVALRCASQGAASRTAAVCSCNDGLRRRPDRVGAELRHRSCGRRVRKDAGRRRACADACPGGPAAGDAGRRRASRRTHDRSAGYLLFRLRAMEVPRRIPPCSARGEP